MACGVSPGAWRLPMACGAPLEAWRLSVARGVSPGASSLSVACGTSAGAWWSPADCEPSAGDRVSGDASAGESLTGGVSSASAPSGDCTPGFVGDDKTAGTNPGPMSCGTGCQVRCGARGGTGSAPVTPAPLSATPRDCAGTSVRTVPPAWTGASSSVSPGRSAASASSGAVRGAIGQPATCCCSIRESPGSRAGGGAGSVTGVDPPNGDQGLRAVSGIGGTSGMNGRSPRGP